MNQAPPLPESVRKLPTGVAGFDEITGGGLPRGRVTLLLGGPGTGKTIFSVQTLATAARAGAPGLFVALEEPTRQVVADTDRFTWRIGELLGSGIALVDAQIAAAILNGGDFDLVGFLAMLAARAEATGAVVVVFDGLDVLLGQLGSEALVRHEMFRIREWLHETGLTGIITAKVVADRSHDLYDSLQFVADCVVTFEHVRAAGTALRNLRVSKYRGEAHSANDQPFTITGAGIEIAGATSNELEHVVSREKVTSGVERLDVMLGGGYFRHSSILISGAPGTAKTSLAIAFAVAACARGERTVFVSFDEAPAQIVRNMESIGIALQPHLDSGLLRMSALRTRSGSPEAHVARIRALLTLHQPENLIVDPISALAHVGGDGDADRAALQLLDLAKSRAVTFVGTTLLADSALLPEEAWISIASEADTWMRLSYVNLGGERNRALSVIKARGTPHSNQVRELVLSSEGLTLADVYPVGGDVLMGTLRGEKENEVRRDRARALRNADMRQREAELALAATRARGVTIGIEEELRAAEVARVKADSAEDLETLAWERRGLVTHRGGDPVPAPRKPSAGRA